MLFTGANLPQIWHQSFCCSFSLVRIQQEGQTKFYRIRRLQIHDEEEPTSQLAFDPAKRLPTGEVKILRTWGKESGRCCRSQRPETER